MDREENGFLCSNWLERGSEGTSYNLASDRFYSKTCREITPLSGQIKQSFTGKEILENTGSRTEPATQETIDQPSHAYFYVPCIYVSDKITKYLNVPSRIKYEKER